MTMETRECCSSKERSCGPDVHITSATPQPSPWASTRCVKSPRVPFAARCAKACSNSTAIFAKNPSPVLPYNTSSIPEESDRFGGVKRSLARRMVVRSLIVFVFVALVFAPAGAQSSFPALLAEEPAPEHQDKLMLFGQFVGSWNFDGVEYRDDGSRRTDKGEIHFHWVLQGRAIQDVFLETERRDSDPKIYGSTVRFYDPRSDSWRGRLIDSGFWFFFRSDSKKSRG